MWHLSCPSCLRCCLWTHRNSQSSLALAAHAKRYTPGVQSQRVKGLAGAVEVRLCGAGLTRVMDVIGEESGLDVCSDLDAKACENCPMQKDLGLRTCATQQESSRRRCRPPAPPPPRQARSLQPPAAHASPTKITTPPVIMGPSVRLSEMASRLLPIRGLATDAEPGDFSDAWMPRACESLH